MNKLISTTMILGAFLVLEANQTTQAETITPASHSLNQSTILLARGGHGGGGHAVGEHPAERAAEIPHTEAREQAANRGAETNINRAVNADVNRDIRNGYLDDGYYGVGGYDTLNNGCWTDSSGIVHCYGN